MVIIAFSYLIDHEYEEILSTRCNLRRSGRLHSTEQLPARALRRLTPRPRSARSAWCALPGVGTASQTRPSSVRAPRRAPRICRSPRYSLVEPALSLANRGRVSDRPLPRTQRTGPPPPGPIVRRAALPDPPLVGSPRHRTAPRQIVTQVPPSPPSTRSLRNSAGSRMRGPSSSLSLGSRPDTWWTGVRRLGGRPGGLPLPRSSVRNRIAQQPSEGVERRATGWPRKALGRRSWRPWNDTQPPAWTLRTWLSGPSGSGGNSAG